MATKKYYSKQEYIYIKNNKDECPWESGYVGIACSYSGKWFGGYAGIVNTKGGMRNYQDESYRNLINQLPNVKDVKFVYSSYENLIIPNHSIIYCDPPYENTTKYKDKFDSDKFWEWCRKKKLCGHEIFISEYNCPIDFKCIWEHEVKSSLSANGISGKNKKSIEKLFTI